MAYSHGVGGTTTDVGLLLANGFPRQAAAYSEFAGVRMNFSCPDVKSIGLGGGSVVRENHGKTTIGPDSVGYKIKTEALVFGGDVSTTIDYTVAGIESVDIGNRSKVQHLSQGGISSFMAEVKKMLEKVVDTMKTTPEDLPVLLVGGGAIIAPDELIGASRVIKPEYSGVANAIGAAIARVSAVIDTVKSTESKSVADLVEEISKEAIQKTVESGAAEDTVKIVEVETLPLPVSTIWSNREYNTDELTQYIANKSRFIIRAAGEFDYSRANEMKKATDEQLSDDKDMDAYEKSGNKPQQAVNETKSHVTVEPVDIATYRPKVTDRVWYVSETDLEWMSIGCYILGTGGGGSPYSHMLRMRSILRDGGVIRVINPHDLKDDDQVGCGGGAGSPTVGIEKLPGDE
jgi:N-methylhydantoinase A/oxoprolinase/acetone carboxylase beta subunit